VSDAPVDFSEAGGRRRARPRCPTLPEGTRTADDAARAIGCDVGQIVKSSVFVAGSEPVLALTSGRNRVDTAKLAAHVRRPDARKATADEVRAATGYAIGGTPPFGHHGAAPVLRGP
jgi:prolyl-tRNA editing enzyme YbaK/EbsC (Cys-tRNA(Pro) deacylase)